MLPVAFKSLVLGLALVGLASGAGRYLRSSAPLVAGGQHQRASKPCGGHAPRAGWALPARIPLGTARLH